MPKACFEEFRTISYDDKIYLYNTIARFSTTDHEKITELIRRYIGQRKSYLPGLELYVKLSVQLSKMTIYVIM